MTTDYWNWVLLLMAIASLFAALAAIPKLRARWPFISVCVILLLGALILATASYLPQTGSLSDSPTSEPECVPRIIPDAKTVEARALLAGIQLEEAKYRLSGLNVKDSEPQIEASGRIAGYGTDSGGTLQMLSWGNPDTVDVQGNAGEPRYFYVESFTIAGRCWEIGGTDVCYPGCEGLAIRYLFVTLPKNALPELELNRDEGLTESDLRRLDVVKVGEFDVPVTQ